MVYVEPGDERWHDKSLQCTRQFTCDNCGEEGHTGEADARCDECGHTTRLGFELEEYGDEDEGF